jgi:hypothetical protein
LQSFVQYHLFTMMVQSSQTKTFKLKAPKGTPTIVTVNPEVPAETTDLPNASTYDASKLINNLLNVLMLMLLVDTISILALAAMVNTAVCAVHMRFEWIMLVVGIISLIALMNLCYCACPPKPLAHRGLGRRIVSGCLIFVFVIVAVLAVVAFMLMHDTCTDHHSRIIGLFVCLIILILLWCIFVLCNFFYYLAVHKSGNQ